MREYVGSLIWVLLSVVISVIGVATHWPWAWEAWAAVVIMLLLGAILTFPVRSHPAREPTAFVAGDASGSTFGNVYSDADVFVRGNARRALFWNIIHRPQSRHRR